MSLYVFVLPRPSPKVHKLEMDSWKRKAETHIIASPESLGMNTGFYKVYNKKGVADSMAESDPFSAEQKERTSTLQIHSATRIPDLFESSEPVTCNGGQFYMCSPSGNIHKIGLQCVSPPLE